jgi:hypothetical protein
MEYPHFQNTFIFVFLVISAHLETDVISDKYITSDTNSFLFHAETLRNSPELPLYTARSRSARGTPKVRHLARLFTLSDLLPVQSSSFCFKFVQYLNKWRIPCRLHVLQNTTAYLRVPRFESNRSDTSKEYFLSPLPTASLPMALV